MIEQLKRVGKLIAYCLGFAFIGLITGHILAIPFWFIYLSDPRVPDYIGTPWMGSLAFIIYPCFCAFGFFIGVGFARKKKLFSSWVWIFVLYLLVASIFFPGSKQSYYDDHAYFSALDSYMGFLFGSVLGVCFLWLNRLRKKKR